MMATTADPNAHPSLNRTSVGLKLVTARAQVVVSAEGLNRTSVGLKRALAQGSSRKRPCLNRTSVGLKPDQFAELIIAWLEPQSNQRGIETPSQNSSCLSRSSPQSNQRGIETRQHDDLPIRQKSASIEPAWD